MKNYTYQNIATKLSLGHVIAYPTESVYGLGVDPHNSMAIERLLQLKQRESAQGLILIAHDLDSISPFIKPLTAKDQLHILQLHNGYTHTWLVPFSHHCPAYLHGDFSTIAIRITLHPIAKKICESFGPIVSTSANIHGSPPATHPQQIRNYFGDQLHIIEGELGLLNSPTQIIDLRSGKIIRA